MDNRDSTNKTLIPAVLMIAATCLVCSCGDEESGGVSEGIKSAIEVGKLEFKGTVLTRDGGYSFQFSDRSVWAFGDTLLAKPGADGLNFRSSTWSYTTDTDASDGLGPFEESEDSAGVPGRFIPLTDQESEFNAAQLAEDCTDNCGDRVAIWPGPMVVDPDSGQALLFYSKYIVSPGQWNWEEIGHSIATWENIDSTPVRTEVRPGTDEPTLLFQKDDHAFTQGAIIVEGFLYAYACEVTFMAAPCRLGRVPVKDAVDRSEWRFSAWDGEWTENIQHHTVLQGGTMMSVHWNEHLGKYVAVHNAIVSADVVYHLADAPDGPWTGADLLFTGTPTDAEDIWNYGGFAHPEFSEQDGKIEYITYYRPGTRFDGEIRLVRVTFY